MRCIHGKLKRVCLYCYQDEISRRKNMSCCCNNKSNVKVKKLVPEAIMPKYAKDGDAGADICAVNSAFIPAGGTHIVKTGLSIELPDGYEAQIRSRSGLAAKKSVFVLNSPGTIDCGYRGEICVILHNAGSEDFVIEVGDRIAQMVIKKVNQFNFVEVDELSNSERGEGGIGSTGIKTK